MAQQTEVLFDQTSNQHIGYREVGRAGPFRAELRVGQSGLSQGVEILTIENDKLRCVLLPTRGMSLWKVWYRGPDGDEHIGWNSPNRGPVHPAFVPLTEPGGLGWLDGFDELLVRCGLESNGAPEFDETGRLVYPLHGRIGNRPAYRVELTVDEVGGSLRVTGWVEETRFHFLKLRMKSCYTIKAGSSSIEIEDEITNLSASPAEFQMLYHVNFGQPLLDAGSQVVCAASDVVPRNDHAASAISTWNSYSAETAGYEEQVYFAKLLANAQGETSALLKNAHSTRGANLRFHVQQLPCFSVWKNTTASEDGYVTGIEPGTNFPNPRSFEGQHGRVKQLGGGESTTLNLGIDYLVDEESVHRAEQSINQLQSSPARVHPQPLPDWCAA